jgi:hypothetical protein
VAANGVPKKDLVERPLLPRSDDLERAGGSHWRRSDKATEAAVAASGMSKKDLAEKTRLALGSFMAPGLAKTTRSTGRARARDNAIGGERRQETIGKEREVG